MAGIVVVSDTHFSNRKQFGKMLASPVWKGCNSRFHYIGYAFQLAFQYALEHDCEAIVVPGDIFHERGLLKVPVYNAVYEIFYQIANQSKVKLIIMPGNHDMVDVRAMHGSEGLHSLFAMNAMTVVADRPSHIPLDDFQLFMVPFCSDPDEVISNALSIPRSFKTGKPSVLFLHHSIEGAETGPSNWKMPHELKVEHIDALGFDLNISGHYHKHQKMSDRTIYAGALLQHDFGERNYTPGWLHVLPDGTWTQIENKWSPRFMELETDCSSDIDQVANSMDYWNIIWKGDSTEKARWKGVEDASISFKKSGPEGAVLRSQITGKDSAQDMVSKYVKVKTGQDDPSLVEYAMQFLFGL
jgi:DNA repair exonuclease SbcCD nuclease subunit